ncbi:MAG: 50S ribosomal protein L20 [bacterium]
MPMAKSGVTGKKRHKKVLERAKGFRGGRSKLFKASKEAVQHAIHYSYRGRKMKKRDFRGLWILRISAGAKLNGISYSRFISGLKTAGVALNRKVLAHLALEEKEAFARLVEIAKGA